jgi:hypothetical protein
MTLRRDSYSSIQTREEDDCFFQPKPSETILYRDGFCTLTESSLKLNSYFFPGIPKTIPLNMIEECYTDVEVSLPWYSKKGNGLSSDGTTWWALNWRRETPFVEEIHDNVLIHVKNDWLRKGFSVEDAKRFMPLLRRAIYKAKGLHHMRQDSSQSV